MDDLITGAGPACIDIHDTISCQAWAKEGECQRNAKWMSEYCKRSCNKCLRKYTTCPKMMYPGVPNAAGVPKSIQI